MLGNSVFHFGLLFSDNIEPIPGLLQRVIDHLIQWQLLPEYKRPNGCIINFFEEVNIAPFSAYWYCDHLYCAMK